MASPKSRQQVSVKAPAAPTVAIDAINADPGAAAQAAAEQREGQQAQMDSSTVAAASEQQRENGETQQLTWISIDLKDKQGRPVPNEAYKVKVSDGTYREGSLDAQGYAKVEGIPPGQCEITFPRLHKTEWRRA
jgi:hypothetical protein